MNKIVRDRLLQNEGRNGNVNFFSNWKCLEKEDPELYNKIIQIEGFSGKDDHVSMSRFGLWISRWLTLKLGGMGIRRDLE